MPWGLYKPNAVCIRMWMLTRFAQLVSMLRLRTANEKMTLRKITGRKTELATTIRELVKLRNISTHTSH